MFIKFEVGQTLGKRLNNFCLSSRMLICRAATPPPHKHTHPVATVFLMEKRNRQANGAAILYYISALVSVLLTTLAYFCRGLLDVLIMMLSLCNKSVSPKVPVWSSLMSGDIHIKRIQRGIEAKPSHKKLALKYGQVWMMHSFPHSHCQAHFPPPPHKSREKLSQ